jgi:hypothetical protein
MGEQRVELLWVVLSVALLVGAGVDRLSLVSPIDPAPYHARLRELKATAPIAFGHWLGQDVQESVEAAEQLHPNVFISRRYHNTVDGRFVELLLVQCWDVRDLAPHYPPVCYPGRGLTEVSSRPLDWPVANLTVNGTEYEFEATNFETDKLTIVENFMILPDGRTCRDMNEVRREIALSTRYFGAAQVQLVFQSDLSAEKRQDTCKEFIQAYKPLIDAIRLGVQR